MTEIGAESRRLLQESESTTPNVFPATPDGAPQSSGSRQVWQEVGPSTANGPPAPTDVVPGTMAADLANDPACPPSPHGTPRWEIDLAYVPTTIDYNDNHMGDAFRLNLAHEDGDGYGRRGRLWVFHQDFNRWFDLTATTFSYDLYRRVRFERGEITYGWGPMALYDTTGHDSHFFAAGASIFAEGFYPLLRYQRTEFGPVGSARLAAMIGVGDDDGSLEFGTDTLPIIDEYSWGLELRHRFGDKMTCINIFVPSPAPTCRHFPGGLARTIRPLDSHAASQDTKTFPSRHRHQLCSRSGRDRYRAAGPARHLIGCHWRMASDEADFELDNVVPPWPTAT